MNKKERKLPNRTDIPIDITNIVKKPETKAHTYTFTATSIPSDWLGKKVEYKEEKTDMTDLANQIAATPFFFTPEERMNSQIASLRLKARKLLDKPFSASNTYIEFGSSKFPKAVIECHKCGNKIEFVVDFFIHGVLDHNWPYKDVEMVFENILDRIQSIR